ncbi:MAG: hypothetical protein Q7S66_01535 [bacterium]|nr:hypothetical protein [bacterium]
MADDKKIQVAGELGQRIGFWLAALCKTEAELTAWATVMGEMDESQLAHLAESLEQMYLMAKTASVDQQFADTLVQIQTNYAQSKSVAEQKALVDMAAIEAELKALE